MRAQAEEAVIRVSNLHKRFGRQRVHEGIDLDVRRGEFLSVIGTSGSGKSTLLHEVIGLVKPDAGAIRVLGNTLHELDGEAARLLRRRWGVLFQHGALFSAFNVFDNIAFPMRELRKEGWTIDEAMVRDSVALKLHMVGLDPGDAWKRPAELSGGMSKRAALARALMLEAELLFLDEPTTGLDPASSSEFDALLGSLHKELNLKNHPSLIPLRKDLLSQLEDSAQQDMQDLHEILASTKQILDADNREHISASIRQLDAATAKLDAIEAQLLPAAKQMPALLESAKQSRDESHALLANANRVAQEARTPVQKAGRVEDTIQHLGRKLDTQTAPDVEALSASLTRTSRLLEQLIRELKAKPQSLIFGPPAPPPGPGEPGFRDKKDSSHE